MRPVTPTPEHRQALLKSIHVLLVEDDPGVRDALTRILGDAEMDVTAAPDGTAALRELGNPRSEFDAVVTDRLMPGLDGLELLHEIKSRRDLALLPVIILTVASEPHEVVEGIDAGAHAYIAKPVDRDVLVSTVRAAAADWRHMRQLSRHVRSDAETLTLARQARFEYRSPDQAMGLGALLAKVCPDPDRVVMGLSELLVNAVEHGNLEIGYDEKSRLLASGDWLDEVERRLTLDGFADRTASVELERAPDAIVFTIRDQGRGFVPEPYLVIDPARVLDTHGRGIAMAKLLSFDELRYTDGGRCAIATVRTGD